MKPEPEPLTLDSLYDLFRRAVFWAAVIGVLSLIGIGLFAFAANRTANDSRDAVDLVVAQRADARVVACNAERDSATKLNKLNDRVQDLLTQTFNAPRPTPRSKDQQAQIDAYLADQRAQFDSVKVPVRVCTKQAIEDYYSGKK